MTIDLFDDRDARFVLFDVLRIEELAESERYRHVDRETTTMDAVIEEASGLPSWSCHAEQLRWTRDSIRRLPAALADGSEQDRLRNQLLSATPFMEVTSDLLVAYFLLWGAMVAERKLAAAWALPTSPAGGEGGQGAEASTAHLLGRLASARHFIANVLPVVDGRIEALKWMEVSACTMSEASF
jgi:hypothetical protein